MNLTNETYEKNYRMTEDRSMTMNTIEVQDLTLYIAVSHDIIFERKIADKYKEYFVPERISYEVTAGYFNIKIYRIR